MNKKMCLKKRISFMLFSILCLCQFLLLSCESVMKEQAVVGYLSLRIGESIEEIKDSRSVFSLDEIDSFVTFYELIYFNDSECEKLSIVDVDSKIAVPVGTWNVICLAGTSVKTNKLLIGSGYVDNIEIKENEITEISMNMYSVDVYLSSDKQELYCEETYKVTASINTKNPYLIPKYIRVNNKEIKFNNCSPNDTGVGEYTAGTEAEELICVCTTCQIILKTDAYEKKLSEISSFDRIINSTVVNKDGVTSLKIIIKKKSIPTGLGLYVKWLE